MHAANRFLLLFSLLLSNDVFSWTTSMDCEVGSSGQLPPPANNVTWGTLTTIDSGMFFSGAKSCKFSIKKGTEGWPSAGGPLEWGSIFAFPTKVKVGEELRLRFALYLPQSFPISTNSGFLKFIRLKTRVSDLSRNTGCVDFFMADPSALIWDPIIKKDSKPPYVVNFEGAPGLTLIGRRPVDDVRKGVWETYEVYVKVDSMPLKQGGSGLMKVWRNNQLLVTLDNQILVADKTGYMDAFFFFTYWNGNAPSDAYALMDDVIITTDQPSNVDASGFPIIGGKVAVSPPGKPVLPSAH